MSKPKLPVKFFRTTEGREPVREWLKALPQAERKAIGDDIRTVLWEVRIDLPSGIARVLFTVFEADAVLLHGFIKKSEKTPLPDLKTAKQRKKLLK